MSQTSTMPVAGAPAGEPSKVHIFIIAVLLLANLAGTGFIASRILHAPPAGAGGHEDGKAKEEADKKALGPVVPIDGFVVNLNEPNSSRYLKTSFEVELVRATGQKDLEDQKRPVRDEILSYLSSLTINDTLGDTGKAKIKAELVARMEKVLGPGTVKRLFFTDFVVQ